MRYESPLFRILHYPNVVQVFDRGQHDGLPFIALEFVPGGSLAGRLDKGRLPAAEAARLVEQVARGVLEMLVKAIADWRGSSRQLRLSLGCLVGKLDVGGTAINRDAR